MTLRTRAFAAILALAALPLANATDASSAPAHKLSPAELQKVLESVANKPLITLARPTQVGPDQSWIYREDTQSNGQHDGPSRTEVTTAFQNRRGDWLVASRSLTDASAPAPRFTRLDGCLVDAVDGARLQAAPCTAPSPGDTWTIGWMPTIERSEFKAVGREALYVPAGTLETLRIEKTDFKAVAQADGTRATVPIARSVYWYAPSVFAMARVERDTLRPDGTVAMHAVRVLETYGSASEAAKSAIRATPQWAANEHAKEVHARIAAAQAATPPLSQQAVLSATSPKCRPEYPPAAVRAGAMGQTRLALLIGADGSVQESEVADESGPTREHQLLDNAARASLSTCPFSPALGRDGQPTASVTVVTYTWKLD